MPRAGKRRAKWAAPVAFAVVAAATVGAPASTAGASAGNPEVVTVSATACAPGWQPPRSGQSLFTLNNVAKDTAYTVELLGPGGAARTAIYGEVTELAPGTQATMDVVLPAGTYFFDCTDTSGASIKSALKQVTGSPVAGAQPYVPLTAEQAHLAATAYRSSATVWLGRLKQATASLADAVKAHELARARALWLPAHLDYARLGAADGILSAFDQEIDGPPQGVQGGVDSPFFAGFLRLEYGLWHGQSASELIPIASALYASVTQLVGQFPKMTLPITDLASGAEATLEGAQQLEMTGETDEGSNTNLATAWANVQAVQMALSAFSPALGQSDPDLLAELRSGLANLAVTLEARQARDGTWEPEQDLTTSQREHLDGELDNLLQELAALPGLLQVQGQPRGGGA